MLKNVFFACAIAFLSAKTVLAQEVTWVSKPIQCDTVEEVTKIIQSKGLQVLGGFKGFTNSANYEEPIPVLIFLSVNPTTKEWAILEAGLNDNEMCLLTYGNDVTIDADTLKSLIPKTF